MGFSWQAQEIVRLRGVMGVRFRGRRSTLCALDVWMRKVSWQAQGIVRLRVVVEVNVAVTLGFACERALFGGLESRNCLMCVLRWVFPLDFWRESRTKCSFHVTSGGSLVRKARFRDWTHDFWRNWQTRSVTFGGSLVRNARFADSKREFLTKSRTKRSFWRIDA